MEGGSAKTKKEKTLPPSLPPSLPPYLHHAQEIISIRRSDPSRTSPPGLDAIARRIRVKKTDLILTGNGTKLFRDARNGIRVFEESVGAEKLSRHGGGHETHGRDGTAAAGGNSHLRRRRGG